MKHFERFKQCPALEVLENRRLLAAPITEFSVPARSAGFTAGPDGNFWFTLVDNQIGRITPAGQVTTFPIPATDLGPRKITPGPDGNLWFTTRQGDTQIGRITPTGQVTLFPTGTSNADIVAGPDGNLWYTEDSSNTIGQMTPAGQVTEFPVSFTPTSINAGPDGRLWITEYETPLTSDIGWITTDGKVTESHLPGSVTTGATFGPDGNFWFTEYEYVPITTGTGAGGAVRASFLSRITPGGEFTDRRLTGPATGGDLTFGSDGNPWFVDDEGNAIGRIGLTGLVAEFPIPTADSQPSGIVAGPDGNIWFTEGNAAKVGRFCLGSTDLGLGLPAQPVTGTAGEPLTYTITVTNHSAFAATDAVLTEKIPATSNVPQPVGPSSQPPSISASQGTVKQIPTGGFIADLGSLASGATATITIVATYANPQTITSQLAVYANESDTNPGDDTATLTTTISSSRSSGSKASPNPPHVSSLRSIHVKRKGLTAVNVSFDEPMDPASVSNLGIYHLVSVGKGKKPRLTIVRLASATYDAGSHTVRLALKKPFKPGTLRLTIDHTAPVAANGKGLAGGDYVATVPK